MRYDDGGVAVVVAACQVVTWCMLARPMRREQNDAFVQEGELATVATQEFGVTDCTELVGTAAATSWPAFVTSRLFMSRHCASLHVTSPQTTVDIRIAIRVFALAIVPV